MIDMGENPFLLEFNGSGYEPSVATSSGSFESQRSFQMNALKRIKLRKKKVPPELVSGTLYLFYMDDISNTRIQAYASLQNKDTPSLP